LKLAAQQWSAAGTTLDVVVLPVQHGGVDTYGNDNRGGA
jgi:hypothetical protein